MKAVIAKSFERIHRSNLVGMGIVPLCFKPGQDADSLGLTGYERYTVHLPADASAITPGMDIEVTTDTGVSFTATLRFDTQVGPFTTVLACSPKAEHDCWPWGVAGSGEWLALESPVHGVLVMMGCIGGIEVVGAALVCVACRWSSRITSTEESCTTCSGASSPRELPPNTGCNGLPHSSKWEASRAARFMPTNAMHALIGSREMSYTV